MNRRNLILGAVLLVQLVLVALLWWPRSSVAGESGPLLADVTADEITGIVIDGDGRTVTLARNDSGWVLPEADDYPVNEVSVTSLISKVVALDMSRPVANTAGSHRRLQVDADDYVRKVDLTTSDGATHTLYLGTSPSARATHVRLDGQNTVYLQNSMSTTDLRSEVSSWINTSFLSAVSADVQAITLENANGVFALQRDVDDTWTMDGLEEGETVNQSEANALATRATLISMNHPLGKGLKEEYGLEPPLATLSVTLASTATITDATGALVSSYEIAVGTQNPDDNTYPVRTTLSEYIVAVPAATLTSLISDTRDSLVVAPVITDTTEITSTTELSDSGEVTSTDEVTDTDAMTDTDVITATDTVTVTDEVTDTDAISDTDEDVDANEESDTSTPTPRATPVETSTP